LSLVKCTGCGVEYNGKSGRRVEKAIRVYTTAALGILILLAACMIYSFLADSSPKPTPTRVVDRASSLS
jgi:hypothetical protein